MKKIIVLSLALSLAGCANGKLIFNPFGSITNPVSMDSLAKVEAAYGAAESIALAYRNACANKEIPSSCRPIVVQIQNADNYAYNQIQVARKFVKSNPSIDASVLISTAQDAVDAFKKAADSTKAVQ